jgi:integrase
MAYAEKRGNLWRARWCGPDGTLESKPGFTSRKDAENYGRDQEAAIRSNTYVDPRAGKITLTDWVNQWYPALDLEPTTLAYYRYEIEVHILPAFGDRGLLSITPQEVAVWEKRIIARGYSQRTARGARTVLTTLLGDAIPRHIQLNPAQRKRGKGRKGQRRILRSEQAEKVWPTPLEALLIAERCAALSGRDEDFLMGITAAYTGMRWSEITGLLPDCVQADVLNIDWKLYELGGRFYQGRPKDGSIRPADLPPFLAELLASHIVQNKQRRCRCRNTDRSGPGPGLMWCPGSAYVFLSPGGSHYRRSSYGVRYFRLAADGSYPARSGHPAKPVLVDAAGLFPGAPLAAWPAAEPGRAFIPPSGRGVTRLVSDDFTGRCSACRRAFPRRLDGTVVAHKAGGGARCPGSGEEPGEDLAVASWLPVSRGLTPHGYRHAHKVWMDEDQIPDVLKSERLGHDEPGMRGVYGHVSPAMRAELKAALQARWEDSLCQRARLSSRSIVPLLDTLLTRVKPLRYRRSLPIGSQNRTPGEA